MKYEQYSAVDEFDRMITCGESDQEVVRITNEWAKRSNGHVRCQTRVHLWGMRSDPDGHIHAVLIKENITGACR